MKFQNNFEFLRTVNSRSPPNDPILTWAQISFDCLLGLALILKSLYFCLSLASILKVGCKEKKEKFWNWKEKKVIKKRIIREIKNKSIDLFNHCQSLIFSEQIHFLIDPNKF